MGIDACTELDRAKVLLSRAAAYKYACHFSCPPLSSTPSTQSASSHNSIDSIRKRVLASAPAFDGTVERAVGAGDRAGDPERWYSCYAQVLRDVLRVPDECIDFFRDNPRHPTRRFTLAAHMFRTELALIDRELRFDAVQQEARRRVDAIQQSMHPTSLPDRGGGHDKHRLLQDAMLLRELRECVGALASLREPLLRVLGESRTSSLSEWFREPVDAFALNLGAYFETVQRPMDLATMTRLTQMRAYTHVSAFMRDAATIRLNARSFFALREPVMLERADAWYSDFFSRVWRALTVMPETQFRVAYVAPGQRILEEVEVERDVERKAQELACKRRASRQRRPIYVQPDIRARLVALAYSRAHSISITNHQNTV